MRHHHSIEAMLLYYPQDTTENLGPTVLLPGTSYWEDGPKPPEGMAAATPEERDSIYTCAYERLGWPKDTAPHKVIVKKGTVALVIALLQVCLPSDSLEASSHQSVLASQVHFDIYHRGSRRLKSADDEGRKRLMYKFWLSRTKDPTAPSWDHTSQPDDDCPAEFGGEAPGRLGSVWTHAWNWLRGVPEGSRAISPPMLLTQQKQLLGLDELETQLLGESEPERIAASYELAVLAHSEPLALAALHRSLVGTTKDELLDEVQGDGGDNNAKMELGLAARRAATYGLISLGPQLATSTFLTAAHSSSSDIRAYGAHGLGEAGDLNDVRVVDTIAELLANE